MIHGSLRPGFAILVAAGLCFYTAKVIVRRTRAALSELVLFAMPALAIAVYNIGLIGGLLFTLAIPSIGIYGPTYGVLAAALCHVAVQIPGLVEQGARYFFTWNLIDPGLRQVLRIA